jgi:hypothetical protein
MTTPSSGRVLFLNKIRMKIQLKSKLTLFGKCNAARVEQSSDGDRLNQTENRADFVRCKEF